MAGDDLNFGDFRLDLADRRLTRDGAPVEINARYLDALALLVRERGRLVTKDRFLEEVWRGVPVTDEALTQCIRTLRRQLGDSATSPRFIETVPKHGYRFIASAGPHAEPAEANAAAPAESRRERRIPFYGVAGTIGAAVAGVTGGIIYGFVATAQPMQAGASGLSVLLVMTSLTVITAIAGGLGVAFGIAATGFAGRAARWTSISGGAAGGMAVGALVKLLGVDAFNLLFGQTPGDITGAPEGLLLGGAVGAGAWLGGRGRDVSPLRRSAIAAALCAALAGGIIPLLGGRMMGGSLDLLAHQFPQSRLRLDAIGALLGEDGFGQASQIVTGALEGALFGSCLVAAMILARRTRSSD